MSPFEITGVMFAGMLLLMSLGLPVTFCLGSVGVLASYFLWGAFALDAVYFAVIDLASNFILTAIPMYIFMGYMLHLSNIADDLFDTINKWAGGLNGALGIGTVVISAFLAAMIGISGATVLSLGAVVVPAMISRGYNKRLSVGLVMSGGALGFLIPPSMMMILYGFLGDVSVGQLFAAGLMPGLLLATLYIIYIGVRCFVRPQDGPTLPFDQRPSLREKIISLKHLVLPGMLAFGILGSILGGVASPTEAAAAGAGFSIICTALRGNLTWKMIMEASNSTLRLCGFAGFIVVAALIFSKTYTGLGATAMIKNMVIGLDVSPWAILIIMQLSFFVLGALFDDIAILFMCMPIYLPIIRVLGFDPVWFGILYVMNMQMAYLTPPYGLNLFYMKSVAPKDITINDIYASVWPFLLLQLVALGLVMTFPEIATWLPNVLFNK